MQQKGPMRFIVTHGGETIGSRAELDEAIKLGRTVTEFIVLDSRDDDVGGIEAPWKAASCDGTTLIVNHPGGGQTITHLGEN